MCFKSKFWEVWKTWKNIQTIQGEVSIPTCYGIRFWKTNAINDRLKNTHPSSAFFHFSDWIKSAKFLRLEKLTAIKFNPWPVKSPKTILVTTQPETEECFGTHHTSLEGTGERNGLTPETPFSSSLNWNLLWITGPFNKFNLLGTAHAQNVKVVCFLI